MRWVVMLLARLLNVQDILWRCLEMSIIFSFCHTLTFYKMRIWKQTMCGRKLWGIYWYCSVVFIRPLLFILAVIEFAGWLLDGCELISKTFSHLMISAHFNWAICMVTIWFITVLWTYFNVLSFYCFLQLLLFRFSRCFWLFMNSSNEYSTGNFSWIMKRAKHLCYFSKVINSY